MPGPQKLATFSIKSRGETRFRTNTYHLHKAVLLICVFVIFAFVHLAPKSHADEAEVDKRVVDGQRQFDVIEFQPKDIERKIPGVKGVRARIRADLSAFESSTDPNVEGMRNFVADLRARDLPPKELLATVNKFINAKIRYVDDWDGFAKKDYWASPFEVVERRQGDCEDFAILKIVTLHLAGWDKADLGILVGKLASARGAEGHAVALARWLEDGAYHYRILDNLTNKLYRPRDRPAFKPLYILSPEVAGKLTLTNTGRGGRAASKSPTEEKE